MISKKNEHTNNKNAHKQTINTLKDDEHTHTHCSCLHPP